MITELPMLPWIEARVQNKTTLVWEPVLGAATVVRASRGGSRGPIGYVSVDVGTLSITFRETDYQFQVNQKIQVYFRFDNNVEAGAIFTGTVSDFSYSYQLENNELIKYVELLCTDSVQTLSNITVDSAWALGEGTTTFLPKPPVDDFRVGYEGWTARVSGIAKRLVDAGYTGFTIEPPITEMAFKYKI